MKSVEEMTKGELWVEGFCGLLCPFPRLMSLRRNIDELSVGALEELAELQKTEMQYYLRRSQARARYYEE